MWVTPMILEVLRLKVLLIENKLCGSLSFSVNLRVTLLIYIKSRGSVTTPVTAAAAATSGLAKSVRAPGP